MAILALVPETTESVIFCSSEDSFSGDLGAGDEGREFSSGKSTLGRMANLRQCYSDKSLSTGASELLLSSWRHKNSQSCYSLCRKWISWCTERNSDLISGPVTEVVNFQHPLVSRLLKGAFRSRPHLLRYTGTWDVSKVLFLLAQQDISDSCSLKVLSLRTTMLLALT